MQEIKRQEVGGVEYEFYYIPPTKALPLGVRLAKMIAGPVGGAFDSGSGLAGALDSNINIGQALKDLAITDEKEFTAIVKELLGCVRLGTGMEINIDQHFEGKLLQMMEVAVKSFEHNYKDFFDVLRGRLGEVIRRVVPGGDTTQAKRTSTGSSGASSSQGQQHSRK